MFKKPAAEVKDTLCANIVTHAWNKDHTQVAISPNSNKLLIYDTKSTEDVSKWELLHNLSEHDGLISCIDWCHETNVIVSCSHDRNAYVWNFVDDVWKPTLVILRVQRAATHVKWSPNGNKFAVSSAAKCVAVCHYEEAHDFWVSKTVRKHKSTVLCVDWCPNNKFIITGSTDMKCRVFSAFIEGIDPQEDDGFGEVFGSKQNEFGELLCEFGEVRSWINAVAWSADGFRLAYAGHGGEIAFVQLLAGDKPKVQIVNTKYLPFMTVNFLTKDTVVACGYDKNPTIFVAEGDDLSPEWSEKERVDKAKADSTAKAAPKKNAAFAMFQNMDAKGESSGPKAKGGESSETKHKSQVQSLDIWSPTKFTTAGMDGRVLFWDLKKLGFDTKALKCEA